MRQDNGYSLLRRCAVCVDEMFDHPIDTHLPERLTPFVGERRAAAFRTQLHCAAQRLAGRRLVNITGNDQQKGGVFEILRSTLPYLKGAGIDVAWWDITTAPEDRPALEFFHLLAHGAPPSPMWRDELAVRTGEFEAFAQRAATEVASILRADDLIILHDTQTAPLVGSEHLTQWRERIIWHAHIGTSTRNIVVDRYWDVLLPHVEQATAVVFYRPEYAPLRIRRRALFTPPAIDPASSKNAPAGTSGTPRSLQRDDADCPLHWHGTAPTIGTDDVVAVQLSRWDMLKDMPGAVRVFGGVAACQHSFKGLVVGPSAQSAAERRELELALDAHARLPAHIRSRVHVGVIERCGTPAHDRAVAVLQSRADVVLQKSLQEGFGLTVTEAMLRGKPVIASAVGGIPLQIDHGHNGLLVDPECDDSGWQSQLGRLVEDSERRQRLGTQARADVLKQHVVDRQICSLVTGLDPLLTGVARG